MDINRLKQYRAIQKEIKKIESDIKQLKEKSNKYKFGIDTVMSSSPQLPYTKRPITIAGYGYDATGDSKKYKLIKDLIENKLELEKEFKEMQNFISSIKDSEIRQIIEYKYIKGLSWAATATRVYDYPKENRPRMALKRYLEKNQNCAFCAFSE